MTAIAKPVSVAMIKSLCIGLIWVLLIVFIVNYSLKAIRKMRIKVLSFGVQYVEISKKTLQ